MLNVTDDVRECYRHAEECARQAQSVSNPEFRRDFLDLELRWLKLARSYEVSERLKPAGTGRNSSRESLLRGSSRVVSARRILPPRGQYRLQYSLASMIVITRLVTEGSDGSGE